MCSRNSCNVRRAHLHRLRLTAAVKVSVGVVARTAHPTGLRPILRSRSVVRAARLGGNSLEPRDQCNAPRKRKVFDDLPSRSAALSQPPGAP